VDSTWTPQGVIAAFALSPDGRSWRSICCSKAMMPFGSSSCLPVRSHGSRSAIRSPNGQAGLPTGARLSTSVTAR
jgi:hypothetical protein